MHYRRALLWPLRVLAVTIVTITFGALLYTTKPLFISPNDTLPAAVFPSTIVALTNSERLSNSIGLLSVNPLLNEAAQMKASDMVNRGYYAHVSPDGKTPLYWLDQVGYKYLNVGENLVVNVSDSNQAVTAWMNSPEHRDNILRPQFTETGIGVANGLYNGHETTYVVQLFATPYPTQNTTHKTLAATMRTSQAKTIASTSSILVPKDILSDAAHSIIHPIVSAFENDSSIATSSQPTDSLALDENPPIEIGATTVQSPSIVNGGMNRPLVGTGENISDSSNVPSYTPAEIQVWFATITSQVSVLLEKSLNR